MQEPCRRCPERARDFGGCRCQAFALTGDATNADPVCTLVPQRALIDAALEEAGGEAEYVYRHLPTEGEPVGTA